jgi:hypothetical protein
MLSLSRSSSTEVLVSDYEELKTLNVHFEGVNLDEKNKPNTPANPLSLIPKNCFSIISSHLDLKSLVAFKQTNKRISRLVDAAPIWRVMAKERGLEKQADISSIDATPFSLRKRATKSGIKVRTRSTRRVHKPRGDSVLAAYEQVEVDGEVNDRSSIIAVKNGYSGTRRTLQALIVNATRRFAIPSINDQISTAASQFFFVLVSEARIKELAQEYREIDVINSFVLMSCQHRSHETRCKGAS